MPPATITAALKLSVSVTILPAFRSPVTGDSIIELSFGPGCGGTVTGGVLTGRVLTGGVLTGGVLTGGVLTGGVLTGRVLLGTSELFCSMEFPLFRSMLFDTATSGLPAAIKNGLPEPAVPVAM